jgi:hypothetical protein
VRLLHPLLHRCHCFFKKKYKLETVTNPNNSYLAESNSKQN